VGLGIGTPAFQRALAFQADDAQQVTVDTVKAAEWIAGITLTDEQREQARRSLERHGKQCEAIRSVDLAYDTPPAQYFDPQPLADKVRSAPAQRMAVPAEQFAGQRPNSDEDLAFLPLGELASLLKSRQVSSLELTELFLQRLRRFDSLLHCVVTFTDDVARKQAERADRELARGIYRGPLHGIPWGAKDLIAYPGYPTTWGAKPFVDQVLDQKATVAQRLESAGAVLVAKLSLGALAMGDRWQGGMTRNPWNPDQGSSGSSAGPASAVCAGLVPFSLGSETLGSIVSPCRRCSVTGLRPTFGRVSRHGCMPLSWSMDKIGPITRSVDACALVFDAIHGGDGRDPTAVTRPFHWPATDTLPQLRVGMFEKDIDGPVGDAVRALGVRIKPIKLPDDLPIWPLTTILHVEAATSFDKLTRSGVTEGLNRWPGIFHQAHFTSAVDYVRANRIRTLWMERMERVFHEVDLYVQGDDLAITNLTGHPSVVLPFGRRGQKEDDQPSTLVFTGRLYGETELLAFSHAFQRQFEHHTLRPPIERWLAEAQKQKDPTDEPS
jgi:Asp-tRNA(Asn)/Glu-tRNA(Gln) amidotransferase A subunit family amidase